jgi:putative transposase
VLRPPIESTQYTSYAFAQRLIEASVDASVGSIRDGYDNALAGTTISLFKTLSPEDHRDRHPLENASNELRAIQGTVVSVF